MADTHQVYLVPGFFGFANLGRLRYFAHVREFLAQRCKEAGLRARVHVVRTHPTASLPRRAAYLLETVAQTTRSRSPAIHLIGHSSGGLDVRLASAPGIAFSTEVDAERIGARVRSVVTVSAPHYGTPLASFFASLAGQKVLRVLSLSTIYLLRFGHLPLAVLLQIGAVFARLDDLAMNSALLDELFGSLLSDFSIGRRRAVQALFREVAQDQALLVQLTPEGMDLFNAAVRTRPEVRYGCVVSHATPPSLGSVLATGLDPAAQATYAIYQTLYRLAAERPRSTRAALSRQQAQVLRRAYGALPGPRANDGMVPTRSQVWGEIIHAAQADHLDVIGHFKDDTHRPPHVDWLTTGSNFDRRRFEALWSDVVEFVRRSGS